MLICLKGVICNFLDGINNVIESLCVHFEALLTRIGKDKK